MSDHVLKSGGELITVFQYLKGSYKEVRGSLFTRNPQQGAIGTGCSARGFIFTLGINHLQ